MKKLNKFSFKLLITLFLIFNVNQYKMIASINNNSFDLTTDYFENKKDFNYILGPGDQIEINFGSDFLELNTLSEVSVEGTIILPRINEIYISGLTIEELTILLNQKYNDFLLDPNIKVLIKKFRNVNAFILGEVNEPGLYNLNVNLKSNLDIIREDNNFNRDNNYYYPTLFDALKKAGGITRFSDLTNIEIIRVNPISQGGGYKKTNINFVEALLNGNSSLNIRILNDDVIKVKKNLNYNIQQFEKAMKTNLNKKFINVYLSGRVIEPGIKKVSRASVLNDAIAISGGVKVVKGKILLVRYTFDGKVDRREFNYSKNAKRGSYKNPFLNDGDVILVQRGPLASFSEVLDDVTSPLSNFVNTYVFFKALSN